MRTRRLVLTKETLRSLETDEMRAVVGGAGTTDGCPTLPLRDCLGETWAFTYCACG